MFRSTKGKKSKAGMITRRRAITGEENEEGVYEIKTCQKIADNDDVHTKTVAKNEEQEDESGDGDSYSDGDGDDLGSSVLLKMQKQRQQLQTKKKKKNKIALAENRTTVTSAGSKASRKRQRIGFGGGRIMSETVPAQEQNDEDDDHDDVENAPAARLYDKEALAKLKAEQAEWNAQVRKQQQKKQEVEQTDADADADAKLGNNIDAYKDTQQKQPTQLEEEFFIPLNGSDQERNGKQGLTGFHQDDKDVHVTTVLAGDEAIEAQETDLWQDRLAMRAGVFTIPKSLSRSSLDNTNPSHSYKHSSPINTVTIDELQKQFTDTQKTLEIQIQTVNTAYERRLVDMQLVQNEELEHHTNMVQSCGEAVEFYQAWRARAVPNVAALRDLDAKLCDLQRALISCMAESTQVIVYQRRQSQMDDTLTDLYVAGHLKQVLGRQPVLSVTAVRRDGVGVGVGVDVDIELDVNKVDEFGRHVPSQQTLQREKRIKQRETIQREVAERQHSCGINSLPWLGRDEQDWMLNSEIELFVRQQSAMQEALEFALNQIQEKYRDLENLTKLFAEWYAHNPQEYKDCYASLSLADLAAVFIRLEICEFLLKTETTKMESEPLYVKVIQDAVLRGLLDLDTMHRIVDRSIQPFMADLLEEKAYHVSLVNQTKSIIRLCEAFHSVSTDKHQSALGQGWKTTIGRPLIGHFKQAIEEVALAIVVSDSTARGTCEAVCEEQLVEVERLMQNIFQWQKVVGSDLFDGIAENVLNFLSHCFLPFLSSLGVQTQNGSNASTNRVNGTFSSLWNLLQMSTDWLQRPEFLVPATILQAAAEVYHVVNPETGTS